MTGDTLDGAVARRDASPSRGTEATEDGVVLQERIALFFKVTTALSIGGLGLVAAGSALTGTIDQTARSHVVHASYILVAGAAWLSVRGRPRSAAFVRRLDAGATVAFAVLMQVSAALYPPVARPDLIACLITTFVILSRVVVVPSAPRRTFFISAGAWLPLIAVIYFAFRDVRHVPSLAGSLVSGALFNVALWGACAVALATVASQVIYGLRQEIRDARKLGQYTLLHKLGEGGMGQVFRARHAMLRRPTAVKLLHPDRTGGIEDLARFEREVQLTAQLSHPNVVTVFDYGCTPDSVFYYAMELLPGKNLEDVIASGGPMPPGRAIHVLRQVASALAAAHAVGLIHRDVKPANILLGSSGPTPDVAKVVDFGLVKDIGIASESQRLLAADDTPPPSSASAPSPLRAAVLDATVSQTGTILGTPMYLAPEAMRDPASVDARADLYALGAVGYFLLTGTPVFGGATVLEACKHHLHTQPEPPSARLKSVDPSAAPIGAELDALVLELLAKDPKARIASAAEVVKRLDACGAAHTWTEDDARAWWAGHAREQREPTLATDGSAKTVAVDLNR